MKTVNASDYQIGTIIIDNLGNKFKIIPIGQDLKGFQNLKNKKVSLVQKQSHLSTF